MLKYDILINGSRRRVELIPSAGNSAQFTATIDGRQVEADAVQISSGVYSLLLDGQSFEIRIEATQHGLLAHSAGCVYRVEIEDPRSWRGSRGTGIDRAGRQEIVAPMAGKVVRVLVTQGQQVESGQGLLVVEAMKMQNEIRSSKAGILERLLAAEGQAVNAGEVLAVVV